MWLNQMTSMKPRRWLKRLFASRADQTCVSPFHAVEIRCAKNACQAAQDSHGQRYVSAEAPPLPLDQCDQPDLCQCRYQHHADRRDDSRRDDDVGLPTQSDPKRFERRHAKGRRSGDIAEDAKPCSVSEDSYYEYVGDMIHDPSNDAGESPGFDPYNSGSFDKSKSWKQSSGK